ncbi:MAG: pilin [bacterium]|nr:pilin [bacterium]
MRKKLFLFFLLFFLLASNSCFAAVNINVPLFNIPNPTLPQYIMFFFQMAMALGGILAVLSLVFSGIQFIYSSGNPEGIGEAKKRATSAVLGLILLLSSFVIITAINPELNSLDPTEMLGSTGVIFFTDGTDIEKPAPMAMGSLEALEPEYKGIYWKTTNKIRGKPINNCDPENLNAVYVVYWYKDRDFKNLGWTARLKCDNTSTDLAGAGSYLIVKETPGVYFYSGDNCSPWAGSGRDAIPTPHTQSIPEDIGMGGQTVRSIRVVNDPKPKGPSFGLFYLNSTDYRTGEQSYGLQHFPFVSPPSEEIILDNNSYCIPVEKIGLGSGLPSRGVSWVIYKWVGLNGDGSAAINIGGGVTLYTEPSWTGGYGDLTLTKYFGSVDLRAGSVFYPSNTTIPKEKQDICRFWDPSSSCLKSFEIKGNYLVVITSDKITKSNGGSSEKYFNTIKAQVFPISSRLQGSYANQPAGYSIERGTPELKTDYIGNRSAYYMYIFPLAEGLR